MKLIKISTIHFVIVDDSEIKESYPQAVVEKLTTGEWMLWQIDNIHDIDRRNQKVITHSTQSLGSGWMQSIQPLLLGEVQELIGEINIYNKAWQSVDSEQERAFVLGYKECLEDNKDKKYTEEDLRNAISFGLNTKYTSLTQKGTEIETEKFIKSLQPKTEWDVEFVKGKLKLI